MKTMVTKGGITVWLSSRENQFIQEHFSEDKLLEKQNLNEQKIYFNLVILIYLLCYFETKF